MKSLQNCGMVRFSEVRIFANLVSDDSHQFKYCTTPVTDSLSNFDDLEWVIQCSQ